MSSNLANTFVLHNFFTLVVTMTDVSAKLGKTFGDLETNSKTMTTDAAAITTAAATCGATASQYTAAVTTFKVAEITQLGVWSHDRLIVMLQYFPCSSVLIMLCNWLSHFLPAKCQRHAE